MSTEDELRNRGDVLGHFWLPDHEKDASHVAPGVLHWDEEDGAELRLIGPLTGWPKEVSGPVTVWGKTVGREDLTLTDAFVSMIPIGPTALHIRGSTLILGAHVRTETTWPRLILRTANLHEWLPENGLTPPQREIDEHGRTSKLTITWELPPKLEVALSGGTLVFSPVMDTRWAYAPDFRIATDREVLCQPDTPCSIDDLFARFAVPLRSLIVFASDRPDSLLTEVVSDPGAKRHAKVLRRGRLLEPREWRPDSAYLFAGHDLSDFAVAVARWFEISGAIEPALESFAALSVSMWSRNDAEDGPPLGNRAPESRRWSRLGLGFAGIHAGERRPLATSLAPPQARDGWGRLSNASRSTNPLLRPAFRLSPCPHRCPETQFCCDY